MVKGGDHGHQPTTETFREVPAREFRARCLELIDDVQATRRPIVITKRGKPVAKLVPVEDAVPRRDIFGHMKGTVTIHGDIVGPIEVDWHAERGILYIGEDDDRE